MTPQEAIERLRKIPVRPKPDNTLDMLAIIMAVKALEKQIAKKPADYDGKIKVGFCPDCESVVTSDFCDNCGQALDWSDDK